MCVVWFPERFSGIYSSLFHLEQLVHGKNGVEGSFSVTGERIIADILFIFLFVLQTHDYPQIPLTLS